MITTAMLVKAWEEYCEANNLSMDAENRIARAKKRILEALEKIREAEGLLGEAVDDLDSAEITGNHDRIESFLIELDNFEGELANECDDM